MFLVFGQIYTSLNIVSTLNGDRLRTVEFEFYRFLKVAVLILFNKIGLWDTCKTMQAVSFFCLDIAYYSVCLLAKLWRLPHNYMCSTISCDSLVSRRPFWPSIDLQSSGDNHERDAGYMTNRQIYDEPIPNWPREQTRYRCYRWYRRQILILLHCLRMKSYLHLKFCHIFWRQIVWLIVITSLLVFQSIIKVFHSNYNQL